MQATQTPPQAAPVPAPVEAAPLLPQTPVVRVEIPGGGTHIYQLPQTRAEYNAIREQRSLLSEQLNSAASRRRSLAEQLNSMPAGPAREGLEARIRLLDARILRLEADIDATGQLIANAPATALVVPPAPTVFGGAMSEENAVILGGLFTVFVLSPLAIAAARLIFRRAKVPVQAPGAVESAARLERIEQAVEAIAIEVERISEGQRFTTRLLAEGQGGRNLGIGQIPAEKVPLHEPEPVRIRDAR